MEAIVSHDKDHGKTKYLIKWKDHSRGETWESERTALKLCRKLVSKYIEEAEKAKKKANEVKFLIFLQIFSGKSFNNEQVEAVLDHEKKRYNTKYLIKWKDNSRGETWVTELTALKLCQKLVAQYTEEMEKAEKKANEVKF